MRGQGVCWGPREVEEGAVGPGADEWPLGVDGGAASAAAVAAAVAGGLTRCGARAAAAAVAAGGLGCSARVAAAAVAVGGLGGSTRGAAAVVGVHAGVGVPLAAAGRQVGLYGKVLEGGGQGIHKL